MNTTVNNRGYSLVEALMYIALVAILVSVITYAVQVLFVANSIVRSTRNVENSAIALTDRMVREVRAASSVDVINSVLGGNTTEGVLSLIIPNGSGTRTVKFYLYNERVYVDEDGIQQGPLTLSNTPVSSLQFHRLATTTSEAVKFEVVIIGPPSNPGISEKFYGTVVLRGAYGE